MIDKKTGKHYVYRLRHKPTGQYFHELTCTIYRAEEISVKLSDTGDRIFTTAAQLGKLWGRVEKLRSAMARSQDLASPSTPSANGTIERIREVAEHVIGIMDEMEIEISELFTAPNPIIEEKLRVDALKEQAFNTLKSRFSEVVTGSGSAVVEVFNGFLHWEDLTDKDNWTNIISLEKLDDHNSGMMLEKLEELGVKTHIFDRETKPRIMAITDEDLNLLRLTNKNIIRNSVSIKDALELKEIVFRQFGLNT